jgi:hypothetical protein
MAFVGPRANAELVPKLHVALHASHATLPILTSKFRPEYLHMPPFQGWYQHLTFRPNAAWPCSTNLLAPLLISLPFPLPNALPSLQPTFTRRRSGHYLGTSIAESVSLFPPSNVVSLTTLPSLYLLPHSIVRLQRDNIHVLCLLSFEVCYESKRWMLYAVSQHVIFCKLP